VREGWRKLVSDFRFSLGLQISAVLVAADVLFLLFVVCNQMTLHQFQQRYNQEMEQYRAVLNLKKNIDFTDALLYDYIKTGDGSLLEEYQVQSALLGEDLEAFENVEEDDCAFLVESMRRSFHTYEKTYGKAVEAFERGDFGYYSSLTYGQKIRNYMEKYADELLQDTLLREVQTSYQLQKRQSTLGVMNIALAVLITGTIFAFCLYINKNVTIPLNELAQKAREIAKGDLDVRVRESGRTNNVSTTAAAFNKMAESVKASMENERRSLEYEKLLNEARFMALQTQTNPHFLFNTLNSISRTITLGRNEQAQMMLEALAKLMRYNLADAGVPVSLAQELEITNEYIKIQKLRFGARVNVRFAYDENLAARIQIPRFTLQPLVENSIVHGLEPKPGGGTMVLDVKQRRDGIRIRIFDNGVGIEPSQYQRLKEGLQQVKSKRIGIWNTYQRMTIFTGNPKSFRIISKMGAGTMVILTIPSTEVGEL